MKKTLVAFGCGVVLLVTITITMVIMMVILGNGVDTEDSSTIEHGAHTDSFVRLETEDYDTVVEDTTSNDYLTATSEQQVDEIINSTEFQDKYKWIIELGAEIYIYLEGWEASETVYNSYGNVASLFSGNMEYNQAILYALVKKFGEDLSVIDVKQNEDSIFEIQGEELYGREITYEGDNYIITGLADGVAILKVEEQ